MKRTQAYPRQFGEALAKLHDANRKTFHQGAPCMIKAGQGFAVPTNIDKAMLQGGQKTWSDAALGQ
eukprot:4685011-Pyramimonas_sp.AAC.1